MRLKSRLHISVTIQRIKTTYVANIFMLCLLTSKVWSFANIKHNRFVRQLNIDDGDNNDETAVNYEDFSTANPYHQTHFTGNRSVIVQLFEWKFVDIAAECRDFLGPQGYAGVQISPVLEHTVIKTDDFTHPWWERYEVVSYRLASRSGDESEFWSMSRICNEHGVRIYVDVILNHMAAPLRYIGVTTPEEEGAKEDFIVNTLLETNVNLTQLNYSYVSYTHNDFHKPACMVMANTQDAHVIRNCQLNGHPDLDHSRGNVQKQIVKMLNKFIDMGIAGFRIDTAKYMWPIDLKNIFKQVKNLSKEFNFKKNARPFIYHDVFDLGLDAVSKTEYSTYGVVTEYLYPAELSTILRGRVPLSSLINWGPALGFLAHEDSLVFIDSHDTQRGVPWELGNNRFLTYKNRIKYIMANVFMLVHPYGAVKRIMSSYYFPDSDINQGPPVEEADEEEIRSPKFNDEKQCTKESGWVCEHRWPELVSLVKLANYFKAPGNKEDSIIYFQTDAPNQVAFCRGQKAFVAINNNAEMDFVKEVYACLAPGLYCDMVTGGKKEGEEECHGKVLEINDQGYIKLELTVADDKRSDDEEGVEEEAADVEESGKIQSYGIMVIYVESKIELMNKIEAKKEVTENEGSENDAEGEHNKGEGGANGEQENEDGDANENVENHPEQDQQKDEDDANDEEENNNQSAEEETVEDKEEETEAAEEKSENEEEEAFNNNGDEKEPNTEENLEEESKPSETDGPHEHQESDDNEEAKKEGENVENESQHEEDEDGEEENKEACSSETPDKEEEEGENAEEEIEGEENNEGAIAEEGEANEAESETNSAETAAEDGEVIPNESETNQEPATSMETVEEHKETEVETKSAEVEAEDAAEESDKDLDEAEQNPSDSSEAGKEEKENEANSVEAVGENDEKDIDETDQEPSSASDTGNNQSRNLDERIEGEAEEQIEKPSAEVVDQVTDISDTVTAKIQDIQKAGIFSNNG